MYVTRYERETLAVFLAMFTIFLYDEIWSSIAFRETQNGCQSNFLLMAHEIY